MWNPVTNLYKIGKTKNIEARLKSARTFVPKIQLAELIEVDPTFEKVLHYFLKDFCVDREWFKISVDGWMAIFDLIEAYGKINEIKCHFRQIDESVGDDND